MKSEIENNDDAKVKTNCAFIYLTKTIDIYEVLVAFMLLACNLQADYQPIYSTLWELGILNWVTQFSISRTS